jgi:hypothetical protein
MARDYVLMPLFCTASRRNFSRAQRLSIHRFCADLRRAKPRRNLFPYMN